MMHVCKESVPNIQQSMKMFCLKEAELGSWKEHKFFVRSY